jgi:hypothetical protein
MRMRPNQLHAIILLATILVSPTSVSAQLRGCPEVAGSNDRKVVLDAVYREAGSSGQLTSLPTQRLRAKLQEQLSQLTADVDVPTTVVECKNRVPSAAADFSEEQVRAYNSNRVVLEMWGLIAGKAGAQKVNATVGYAVVPLRYYEFFKATAPTARIPGVYFADYSVRTENLESLVEQSNELKIYASVGLGLKMLKEESFDQAKKSFCRASMMLRPPAGKTLDRDHKELQEYIDRMTGVTVDNALNSTAYSGPLKRIDPKIARECA